MLNDISKEQFYSAILNLKTAHGLNYKFNTLVEKDRSCISAYFKFLDNKGIPKASGVLRKYKINLVDVFVYSIPPAMSHDIVIVGVLTNIYNKLGFREIPWVPLGYPNIEETKLLERLKNG